MLKPIIMAVPEVSIIMYYKFAGLLLIVNSVIFVAWWITRPECNKTNGSVAILLCVITIMGGIALIIGDRLTEFSLNKNGGTIKAATEEANGYLKEIKKIKERVESQSATVDAVAGTAAEAKKMSEQTAKQNEISEQKLKVLKETLEKANSTIDKLENEAAFFDIVISAMSDNRKSFDMLQKWSKDKNNSFAEQATKAWNKIVRMHDFGMWDGQPDYSFKTFVESSDVSLDELRKEYGELSEADRLSFLSRVSESKKIRKIVIADLLFEVIKSDIDLKAVRYACIYLYHNIKIKTDIDFMWPDKYVQWWNEHRHEYIENDKPPQK